MFSERKFRRSLSLLLGLGRLLGLVLDGRLGAPLARHGVDGAGAGLEGGHLAQHTGVHTSSRQQRGVVQRRARLVLRLKLIKY